MRLLNFTINILITLQILNPHMHTLIAENEGEDEDDEDEENSQKSCSIISNIVIPASPPRSQ